MNLAFRGSWLWVFTSMVVTSAIAQTPSLSDVREASVKRESASGRIAAIDPKTRAVTLRPSDGGEPFTVQADGVRNFDRLQVGQVVTITYYHAVAMDLQPAGTAEPGAYRGGEQVRAAPGQLPGGEAVDVITVMAPIVAIDPVKHTVAIQGPLGNSRIVAVRNPAYQAVLPQLKKGDLVRVTFTDAVAVDVAPASPEAAAAAAE